MAGTKAGAAKRHGRKPGPAPKKGLIGSMPTGGQFSAIPPGAMVCSPQVLKAVATSYLQIANAIHRELGLATATMVSTGTTGTKAPQKRRGRTARSAVM